MNIYLTHEGDVRIGDFYSACEAIATKSHEPWRHPDDKLEFRAPEDELGSYSFASDMFSVGVTLFEMVTGKVPDMTSLDCDQLLATIDDPAKHALLSFALHADPTKRPTAEELLQKITSLAPSSTLESQFRARVFASMRFSAIGPDAEAKLLRGKLASQGVHLHIIAPLPGESIDAAVFGTMARCDAFLAMARLLAPSHALIAFLSMGRGASPPSACTCVGESRYVEYDDMRAVYHVVWVI